ncbi:MAG: universal stress protein [Anaerolineales bacterium]
MKVFCAVDGSEFSHWGVEALAALSGQRPKTVILLHVVDTSTITAPRATDRTKLKQSLAAVDRAGERLLERLAQTATTALSQAATGPGTKVHTLVTHGPVAETILTQAKRRKVDLLILGSRGLSDIRGFLLGSVSRRAVTMATCPVLVVKRRVTDLQRVLLAVDGSGHSKVAAEFLCAGFLPQSTHLTVLSVAAPMVTELARQVLSPEELERLTKPAVDQAHKLVAAFRQMFLKEGYSVATDVVTGHPSQTILQQAEKLRADLVVAGSRGLTGIDRYYLGSVSESVLKYAPCSVLVVRGGRA